MSNDNKKVLKCDLDKIKVGFCLELTSLNDIVVNDIEKINEFISNNEFLLSHQDLSTILKNFECLSDLICFNIQVILNDVDKDEVYCNYSSKYL